MRPRRRPDGGETEEQAPAIVTLDDWDPEGEDKVIADNEWSPEGTRIIFRETDPSSPTTPTRLRILTFDDCQ